MEFELFTDCAEDDYTFGAEDDDNVSLCYLRFSYSSFVLLSISRFSSTILFSTKKVALAKLIVDVQKRIPSYKTDDELDYGGDTRISTSKLLSLLEMMNRNVVNKLR